VGSVGLHILRALFHACLCRFSASEWRTHVSSVRTSFEMEF